MISRELLLLVALLLAAAALSTVYPARYSVSYDGVMMQEELSSAGPPTLVALTNKSTPTNSTKKQRASMESRMEKLLRAQAAHRKARSMLRGLHGAIRRLDIRAGEAQKQEHMDKARAKALQRAEQVYVTRVQKLQGEIAKINSTLVQLDSSSHVQASTVDTAKKSLNFDNKIAHEQSSVFSFWKKFGNEKAKEHQDKQQLAKFKKDAVQDARMVLKLQTKVNSTLQEQARLKVKANVAAASVKKYSPLVKAAGKADSKAGTAVQKISDELDEEELKNDTKAVDAIVPQLQQDTKSYLMRHTAAEAERKKFDKALKAERNAEALNSGEKLIVQRLDKRLHSLTPELSSIPHKEEVLEAKIKRYKKKSRQTEERVHDVVNMMSHDHYSEGTVDLPTFHSESKKQRQLKQKLADDENRLQKARAQADAMSSMNRLYEKRVHHSKLKIRHIRRSLKKVLKRKAKAASLALSVTQQLRRERSELRREKDKVDEGTALAASQSSQRTVLSASAQLPSPGQSGGHTQLRGDPTAIHPIQ